jgi:hypothetical protein
MLFASQAQIVLGWAIPDSTAQLSEAHRKVHCFAGTATVFAGALPIGLGSIKKTLFFAGA